MDRTMGASVAAAVASLLALHGFAALAWPGPAGVAFLASWIAMFVCVSQVLDTWETRGARRYVSRPLLLLGAFAVLVVLTWKRVYMISVSAEHIEVPPSSGLFMLSLAALLAVILRSAADVLARATRGSKRLRRRLYLVAMVCGGVSAEVAFLFATKMARESASGDSAEILLASIALSAPVTWLLAHPFVRQVSGGVERTAEALRRFAAGELSASVAVQGRDEIAELGRAFNKMAEVMRDKVFLEDAFGRYVTRGVLDALRSSGGLRLPPARVRGTVLFADIRGFTPLSERLPPEEVMALLERYLQVVTRVIERHDGYINKFIGDAVMVVFGAPLRREDHAARAIACAVAMQEAIAAMNHGSPDGEALGVGIGVNSGELVAGTLGGETRAEYTVIGDAVNVASRLTSAALPGEVVATEATVDAAGETVPFSAPRSLAVKGKREPLEVRRWPAVTG